MSRHPNFGRVAMEFAQKQLAAFARDSPGVRAAVLMTADGFEVATFNAGKTVSAKMAAMGSSLQALSSAMAREAQLADIKNTLIEATSGSVLVMAVPDTTPRLTLAVVADTSAIAGHLMWSARQFIASIGGALR